VLHQFNENTTPSGDLYWRFKDAGSQLINNPSTGELSAFNT
jgi:hypothetical protein